MGDPNNVEQNPEHWDNKRDAPDYDAAVAPHVKAVRQKREAQHYGATPEQMAIAVADANERDERTREKREKRGVRSAAEAKAEAKLRQLIRETVAEMTEETLENV